MLFTMVKFRVRVVDDTLRQGTKKLLERRETIEFAGEAPTAQEAIAVVD